MTQTAFPWRRIAAAAVATAALAITGCATTGGTGASRPVTLAEANAAMEASGVLNQYVNTRVRPGGRRSMPKYADRAWNWFVERRLPLNSEERALPANYRERAYAETLAKNLDRSSLLRGAAANWREIPITGSVMPSGRIVEMSVHPTNDQIIYMASASGGVFKTTNRGQSWANVTDGFLPTLGLGSITMDPNNPETLYVGLGEGVPGSHYEPYGSGVYRTTNGGANWSLLNSTSNITFVADIEVLNNSTTIFVASAGKITGGTDSGLFRSTDSGNSFTKIVDLPTFDIDVDRANNSNIVATTKQGQTDFARIIYSTNGGQTFTNATTPSNNNAFRIELTRNGNTMYALVGLNDGSLGGVWKSTNGGQAWSALPLGGIPNSGSLKPGQMYYNCSIQVSPYDANTVYMGSNLRMYRSTDGGQSWEARTDWAGDNGLPYMHADHHTIRFGANTNTVYVGNDGGFFFSQDGTATVTERNVGMTALQYYRMDNHPTDANALLGGLQDNDKYVRRSDGTWRHYPNAFGDCMEVIAHPSSPNTFMGCNYYGGAIRITEDGSNTEWPYIRTYQGQNNGIPDEEKGSWVSPFFYDPRNPNTLYLGLNGVYRTTYTPGLLPQWTEVVPPSSTTTPAQMEALTITSGTSNRKLVGFLGRRTQAGGLTVGLFRCNPDGSSHELLDIPQLAWVSDIKPDPNDNNTLWMTYSDINAGGAERGRIYKTTNQGTSWTDMTNNFPRNLPASAVLVDPNNSNTVFVGSDIGVYRSDNGGASWVYWNEGLPPVVVTDFAYFGPQRKLRVSTYGRGLFETEIDGAPANPDIRVSPETLNFD